MRTYFRIAGAAIIALATTWPQFADCQAYSYGSQPKEVQQNRQQAFGTAAQHGCIATTATRASAPPEAEAFRAEEDSAMAAVAAEATVGGAARRLERSCQK